MSVLPDTIMGALRRSSFPAHPVMAENEVVKIRFGLEQGADGYPPRGNEGLWAAPLGGGAYRVANLPWFVPDVALGDVVHAVADRDGVLWAGGAHRGVG